MELEIFGFKFGKKNKEFVKGSVTFQEPSDGSLDIHSLGPVGSRFVELYNGNVLPTKEIDLIKTYRQIALFTEVDKAVSEIVNDAITNDDKDLYPVKLSLDDVESISTDTKTKIIKEFENILAMLEFDESGYDIFREWYVDGRLFFNIIVDDARQSKGIQSINRIDSLLIKKVREITKAIDGTITGIDEYFLYAPEYAYNDVATVTMGMKNVIKFTPDSVVFLTSGQYNREDKLVLSHLHKAIKPANQLNMIEDAIVIYRVSRAPERRIFYIDVGSLPKKAAEEYMNATMNKYRNKIVYNTDTGQIKDQKNVMSMLEDFWLARREGGKGTEISSLPGGENLGQLEDLIYFRKKLYDSLNVPNGRMESESLFTLAKDSEITREEVKFAKFISRLRKRFSKGTFSPMLKTQCILKKIVAENDWSEIEKRMRYIFVEDSHFAELKRIQVLNDRVEVVNNMAEMVKTYFSKGYIRRNVFGQTEEEIEELKKERKKEEIEEPDPIEDDGFGGGDPGDDTSPFPPKKNDKVGEGDPGNPKDIELKKKDEDNA